MGSPKEWAMNDKIRFLKWDRVPQRCFTSGSWVRTSQAEMPWPGAELVKSSKAQRRLGKPPPFTAEPQSQWGNSFSIGEPAFPKPWPPSPSAGLCWSKSLARALLNSRFHPFPHVPAQKYATWPTYSNPGAACQTPHLREGGQAGLLSGSSLTLFCTKSLCPWSTPGLASLTQPSWEA